MQEEIENRTVNLAVTTTRLSGRVLMDALRMYLRHRDLKKSRNQQTKDDHPHGEQTVKDLIGQNQGSPVFRWMISASGISVRLRGNTAWTLL